MDLEYQLDKPKNQFKSIIKTKFCLVGISNTKLDASKTNRMTMVARPILGFEDYKETALKLYENICKEMNKKSSTELQ